MRKILVIILFAVAGTFADALYSVGAGYSSLGRIEMNAIKFHMGGIELGDTRDSRFFYIAVAPLRFDIRTSNDDVEYDDITVSWGTSMVTVPSALFFWMLSESGNLLSLFPALSMFLASGEMGFTLLNYKYFRLSVFESHVFEWWMYKKNNIWYTNEAGWGQELGLELQFPHVLLSGGAQFEITNKRKGIGWFARINLVEILALKKKFH
ncbi:MAG: hypothetical protein MJY87_01920 [Fibrobacter sp.]|nr:hypothetical protein [Fibrobacter sp.]